jgi:hypothetical protein
MLVSACKGIKAPLHGRPRKPTHHCFRVKLDEQTFPSVFHRGKPRRFQGDLRALDVGLVLAVDIRRHRLEASEADQGEDLTQSVELDYRLDAVAALGVTPSPIGQPAGMKVGIDGHVVAKALGCGEQCVG